MCRAFVCLLAWLITLPAPGLAESLLLLLSELASKSGDSLHSVKHRSIAVFSLHCAGVLAMMSVVESL